MPTKVVVCDTPDGLAQLQYVLIKSGAALEIETVTDGLRAVEVSARIRPELVVAGIEAESLSGAELVRRLLAVSPETKRDLLGGRLAAGRRRDAPGGRRGVRLQARTGPRRCSERCARCTPDPSRSAPASPPTSRPACSTSRTGSRRSRRRSPRSATSSR